MTNPTNIKPLSDAIASPILKAYTKGGYALAFLTLGAILMLIAYFTSEKGILSYFILGVGSLLIFSTLAYFYFKDFRKLVKVQDNIQKNKELIDTVQKTALEMTELTYNLQSLIFKHANQITTALQEVRPSLSGN